MADELRQLLVDQAALAEAQRTLAENVRSIFRTLHGTGDEGGLVTRVAVLDGKRKTLEDRIAALETEPEPESTGHGRAVTIALITAIAGLLGTVAQGCWSFLTGA